MTYRRYLPALCAEQSRETVLGAGIPVATTLDDSLSAVQRPTIAVDPH
jgi:hypothetical protein